MRIGTVADRSGVTAKTIRYYEDIGVLDVASRSPNGYRDYPEEVLQRLAFVRSAQAVGLTLAEIRKVIASREKGQAPCDHVLTLVERRSADLDRRISELHQLRGELDALVKRGRSLNPEDCSAAQVCHIIPSVGSPS